MRAVKAITLNLWVVSLALMPGAADRAWAQAESAHKQLVQGFTDACNARRYSRLGDLVHKNFRRHCQATPTVTVTSLDEFIHFLSADASTFPDAMVTLDQLVEEGDRVAFWGTFAGTQKGPMGPLPASMKKVKLDVAGVFRIEAGKIAELWITWDNMAVFTQLELRPADSESAESPRKE